MITTMMRLSKAVVITRSLVATRKAFLEIKNTFIPPHGLQVR